jgi:hypothetical protein
MMRTVWLGSQVRFLSSSGYCFRTASKRARAWCSGSVYCRVQAWPTSYNWLRGMISYSKGHSSFSALMVHDQPKPPSRAARPASLRGNGGSATRDSSQRSSSSILQQTTASSAFCAAVT